MKDLNKYAALMTHINVSFKDRKPEYKKAKAEIKKVIKRSGQLLDDAVNAMYDRDRIRSIAALARFYARGLKQIGKIPGVTQDDVRTISYVYGQVIDAGLDRPVSDVLFLSTASSRKNEAYLEIRAKDERMTLFFGDYESALEKKLFRMPISFRLMFRNKRVPNTAPNQPLFSDYRKMCILARY
jgi:hypothetical protein